MASVKTPAMLIVLDGWGHSDDTAYNAIYSANTPIWDRLFSESPHLLIKCAGPDVGLPPAQMGNSEVGHMHIGAGRRIDQDLLRISKAIETGAFKRNDALIEACQIASERRSAVHIVGLASPGGVHSHEAHILALADLALAQGARQVYVHALLDGRDTPPKSAAGTLERIARHCAGLGNARIASIVGRYYAMDRNTHWNRIEPAYDLIMSGRADFEATDPLAGLEMAYARSESDEFVSATVIRDAETASHLIEDGDVVIFANFRADRARQLTAAITRTDFDFFERKHQPALGAFVTMTDYGDQFDLPVAFKAIDLPNSFGSVIAQHGLRQLRIAETEKYAHVTFFFNGGEERVFKGEDRILIPSPEVATYDLKPEMSALEITNALIGALEKREYDAIICNLANADMVGHTGNFEATVKCIETLDGCLGRIIEAARLSGVEVLITADHGNAEKMRSASVDTEPGDPHTAHTTNLVPFVYIGRKANIASEGNLCDVAPTMLTLMAIEIPEEMTGKSLLSIVDSAQDAA